MSASMRVAVRFNKRQELKAIPILLRLGPGMKLPGRIHVLCINAAHALQSAGIPFTLSCRENPPPTAKDIVSAKRI
jgi:hypothetical protein